VFIATVNEGSSKNTGDAMDTAGINSKSLEIKIKLALGKLDQPEQGDKQSREKQVQKEEAAFLVHRHDEGTCTKTVPLTVWQ
jgi:NAD-specific glutamate dehydrogenase